PSSHRRRSKSCRFGTAGFAGSSAATPSPPCPLGRYRERHAFWTQANLPTQFSKISSSSRDTTRSENYFAACFGEGVHRATLVPFHWAIFRRCKNVAIPAFSQPSSCCGRFGPHRPRRVFEPARDGGHEPDAQAVGKGSFQKGCGP